MSRVPDPLQSETLRGDIPDSSIGGIPTDGELDAAIRSLIGRPYPPVARRWRFRDMMPSGVWVSPFNYPCPLFQALYPRSGNATRPRKARPRSLAQIPA